MKKHPNATFVRSELRELVSLCAGVECATTITTDGYIVAESSNADIGRDRFGAMSASLIALAERMSQEVDRGTFKQLLVEGDQGYVLLVHAGSDAVLAVMAKPDVRLGLIFIEARRRAKKIGDILAD